MGAKKPAKHTPAESETWDWELEQIARAAKKAEPSEEEQKELVAELARKLLVLKKRRRSSVRHWQSYVRTFLKNKISNWLRDRRRRERRQMSLDRLDEEERDFEETLPVGILRHLSRKESDFGVGYQQLWEELGPKFQRFCLVWAQKEGNQTAMAKTLRMHRNTVRLWMKKIRALLEKHGYSGY